MFAGALPTPAHAVPIRIAYSSISGAMRPLWVAKDRGFFDKHGVDVEVTYISGVAIEAMLAGEVQFVRASPPAVVRSTIRGADPTSFVDASLVQQLEKEGFFQTRSR